MKNGLVIAFGRSGTLFLSQVMNRSKQYTVYHERRGSEDMRRIQPTPTLLKHFSQPYYIEVNSYLRYDLWNVRVAKRGIIIRPTKDIVLSIANRNNLGRTLELIEELNGCYKNFKDYLDYPELFIIDFKRMTTDKHYLHEVLIWFGINDVDVAAVNLKQKVNPNKFISFETFDLLPLEVIDEYNSFDWWM